MANRRLMLHLVPAASDDLGEALVVAAGRTGATLLARSAHCFIGNDSPFRASAEVDFPGGGLDAATDVALAITDALGSAVDRKRSVALIGHDIRFIDGDETTVRYQYLMRRRPDFTHAAYLDRYERVHAQFGLRTPNIEGYTQFHVDLEASERLAATTGFQGPPADSVSELHLRSVAHFIEGVGANPEVGAEAMADEAAFVDRAASHQFVNELITKDP